jgi:hypothetical protein
MQITERVRKVALKIYRTFKADLIAAQALLEDNIVIREALQVLANNLYNLDGVESCNLN